MTSSRTEIQIPLARDVKLTEDTVTNPPATTCKIFLDTRIPASANGQDSERVERVDGRETPKHAIATISQLLSWQPPARICRQSDEEVPSVSSLGNRSDSRLRGGARSRADNLSFR